MNTPEHTARRWRWSLTVGATILAGAITIPAQQMVTETRDPNQTQDEDFAKSVKEWTTQPYFISPLVDHLPRVPGIPTPKDVLGYHIGAPAKLTYYADIYTGGMSETVIGDVLAKNPSSIVVATKGGMRPGPDGTTIDGTPEYLTSAIDASLRRLQVEAIDLYY